MQGHLFSTPPAWTPPTEFPRLKGLVALDFETRDPLLNTIGSGWPWAKLERGRRRDETFGYPVGVALAVPGYKCYLPTAHQGGGNLPSSAVYGYIEQLAKDPEVTFVMSNAPYDLGWLYALEIEPVNAPHDIGLQAPLIDEHRFSYGLDSLLFDLTGKRKNEAGLQQALVDHGLTVKGKGGKKNLWRLPAAFVAEYAEDDAAGTLEVFLAQQKQIDEQGLQQAYWVEHQLMPFVTDMRRRGVRIDIPHAERVREKALRKEAECAAEVKRITGLRLGPMDDKMGQAFVELGLDVPTTRTGKRSVTARWLEDCKHPLARVVRTWRKWNKCRTTFIEGYMLEHAHNGRIHAHFHQLRAEGEDGSQHGTITHRFSSSDPNLQNLVNPERDPEIGYDVRACALPEEDEEWGSIDYASQEPRLITHFAARYERSSFNNRRVNKVEGALAVAERWNADPRMDPYAPITEAAGIKRKQAKTIYLARAYGSGEGGICDQLGLPTVIKTFIKKVDGMEREIEYRGADEEGEAILKAFDEAAPYVKAMKNITQELAQERGYVVGLDGARFRPAGEREFHKMLNKLAQGSAGRQNKRGMLALCQAGYKRQLLVTVHDEIGCSIANKKMTEIFTECMTEAVKLEVPSVVDVQIGKNWGEASIDPKVLQDLRRNAS